MHLDVNTMFLVTINIEAVLGLLLLFAWIQNAGIRALAWWGGAHLLRASAVALHGMQGAVPDVVAVDLAVAVLLTSFAITWSGARVFAGRLPQVFNLFAGAAVWLLLCRIPQFAEWPDGRVLAGSAIIVAYIGLTAYELWRGRAEPLVSRWPAIYILFALGSLFLLRTPLAALLPGMPTAQIVGSVWTSVLSFESMLFTIAVAFILFVMAKERSELRHKKAAMLDPLTGVANRRAFLHEASEWTRRQLASPRPVALLLFDLDHFKSINDRFGEALGDRVLQVFAQTARANLAPSDLVGRIGGEEFGAVIYEVENERAVSVAERIRFAFSDAARYLDGELVCATVSVGVVVSASDALEFRPLLDQADKALTRAKARGGNRVQVEELALTAQQGAALGKLQPAA
jgi:diguanylate cyclase (GGDEF)-like protein